MLAAVDPGIAYIVGAGILSGGTLLVGYLTARRTAKPIRETQERSVAAQERIAHAVGERNGHGSLTDMAQHMQERIQVMAASQESHILDDAMRFASQERRTEALSDDVRSLTKLIDATLRRLVAVQDTLDGRPRNPSDVQ